MLNDIKQSIFVDSRWVGIPFKWGGRDFSGTDCAGLVYMFLREHNIRPLVEDSDGKYYDKNWVKEDPQRFLTVLNKSGKKIPPEIDKLKPYDVLCFKFFGRVQHIGIYLGYGKFLHIHQTINSCIGRLESNWEKFFCGAIRPTEPIENENEFVFEHEVGAPVVAAVVPYIINAIVGIAVSFAISYAIQALSPKPKAPNFGFGGDFEGSMRYGSFGALQSMASPDVPIPILYGELKISSNAIYQSDPAQEVTRCDVLCVGEIDSISDVRLNDNLVTDLEGCSFTAYTGTTTQTVDSRFTGRVPGLRNVAYVALTMKTSEKLSGGFPTLTATCRGQKIQTWTGSQWTTDKTFSNNPAAIIRDFLLNTRYGVGVPEEVLDESSFGEVFEFCDVLVSDNNGGQERRYTLNYIIDSRKAAIDTLSEMLGTFSGYLVWVGNRLRLKAEKAESVVQNFTMSTIIEKSFSFQYRKKDDAINRVKIQYIDPTQNYTKVFAVAEDKNLQDERESIEGAEGIIETELSMFGITRFSQASRIANMFLRSSKATPIACSFRASIAAIHCEVGDLISVSHDVPSWTNKIFRIVSMSEEENDEMSIGCAEYNESVFNDSYGTSIATYQYGSPPNPLKPPSPPTGVTLSETGYEARSKQWVSVLAVSWTAPTVTDFIQHYFVEYSKNGGAYLSIGTTTGTSIQLDNAEETSSYTVRVRSVNYYGLMSASATSSSYTIVGKTAPPSNVTGFSVVLDLIYYVFTWVAVTDGDLLGYEIREGSTWAGGAVINTNLVGTRYTYRPVTAGLHTFRIKAIDTSGNYSVTEDVDTINVTAPPDTNATIDTYIWSKLGFPNNQSRGTLTGEINFGYTNRYNSNYNRGSFFVRTNQTFGEMEATGNTYEDFQNANLIIGEPLATNVSGDYTTAVYDAGRLYNAITTLTVDADNVVTPVNLTHEIRTSTDNITWSSWTAHSSGDYLSFRYFQLRHTLRPVSTTTNVYLNDVIFSIDAPDIIATDGGNGVAISIGGTTVNYARTFSAKPKSLVVSTVGSSSNISPVISEETVTSFKCTLYDTSNNSVSGVINYFAKGS